MASFTREETETTVTGVQEDKYFLIGTNWSRHMTRLRAEVANGRAEVVRDAGGWLEVKVSADVFDPLTGFKKRVSEETRKRMSERMRDMHSKGVL